MVTVQHLSRVGSFHRSARCVIAISMDGSCICGPNGMKDQKALRCTELEKYPWKRYSGFACRQTLVTLLEICSVGCAFRVQTVKAWEVTSVTSVVNSHLCFYWNKRFISKRKVTLLLHSCCIFSNLGWILVTLRDICSLKIMMHFFIIMKFVFYSCSVKK